MRWSNASPAPTRRMFAMAAIVSKSAPFTPCRTLSWWTGPWFRAQEALRSPLAAGRGVFIIDANHRILTDYQFIVS